MRFGWISIGNDQFGSTRLAVTNIHKALLVQGYYSTILNYNKNFRNDIDANLDDLKNRIIKEKLTHVIIHKIFSERAKQLVHFCKDNAVKTLYCNGDWHRNPMYTLCDGAMVSSPYIKNILETEYSIKKVFYIEDALESEFLKDVKKVSSNKRLTLGWFGNYTKLPYTISFLNQLKKTLSFDLITISNPPSNYAIQSTYVMGAETGKKWDVEFLVKTLLDKVDVIVVPIKDQSTENLAKSANRITFPMALGIPVVAFPIDSYSLLIRKGVNGFLCKEKEEWLEALSILINPDERKEIGLHNIEYIRTRYCINYLIKEWLIMFKEL